MNQLFNEHLYTSGQRLQLVQGDLTLFDQPTLQAFRQAWEQAGFNNA